MERTYWNSKLLIGFMKLSLFTIISTFLCGCGTVVKQPVDLQITDLVPKEVAVKFLNTYFKSRNPRSGEIFGSNGVMLHCSDDKIKRRFFTYENLEFELIRYLSGSYRLLIKPKGQEKLPWTYFGTQIFFESDDIERARKAATALVSLGTTYKKSISIGSSLERS
jgi:hypothetical protein